jgi:hypothetical protein
MNTITKGLSLSFFGILAAGSYASATLFLSDSFVTAPASDPANGIYEVDQALSAVANRAIVGGTTTGWSDAGGGFNWNSSGAGLAITTGAGLSSNSVAGSGGAVSFRGNTTTDDRMMYRQFEPYTGPTSTYFSASLSTNFIDDDAISLVAFTNSGGAARGTNILTNGGTGFYNGVAMGFVGNGIGGMDLVLRYRTANTSVYADEVLISGISTDTTYTVMGRIDWESSTENLREDFTVWVNPSSVAEPSASEGITLTGFLGTSTDINSVYLLQKNFGSDLTQAVIMDEIRLGSSWESLNSIPEPATYAMLFGMGAILLVSYRRFKIR